MAGPGIDASIVVADGRVVEYWDGGDPAGRVIIVHPGSPGTRLLAMWGHEAAVCAGVRFGLGESSRVWRLDFDGGRAQPARDGKRQTTAMPTTLLVSTPSWRASAKGVV